MKKIICLLVVISVYFTGEPTYAPQDVPDRIPDRKFEVRVNVTCSDDITRTLIESYIKRELRSLGDVEIVDKEDPERILTLVAIAHTSTSGNKTGDTSIAVMRTSKFSYLPDILNALMDYRQTFEKDLPAGEHGSRSHKMGEIAEDHDSSPAYYYPDLSLVVNIKNEDLQNTCKEIVAKFDVKDLEPIRKKIREINRKLNPQ